MGSTNEPKCRELTSNKKNEKWITEKSISNQIKADYQSYKSSNLNLEQFFKTTIIYGSLTREKNIIFLRKPENAITTIPTFIINNRSKRIIMDWSIKDLQCRQAIKMELKYIFGLFGQECSDLNVHDPPDNVEIYQIDQGNEYKVKC